MVAEDDECLRIAIARSVELFGFQVIEAKDGKEAWAILNEQGSSLFALVTDDDMPHMRGVELVRKLRETHLSGLPVVLASGTIQPVEVNRELDELGVVRLRKPFSMEDLEKTLERFDNQRKRRAR